MTGMWLHFLSLAGLAMTFFLFCFACWLVDPVLFALTIKSGAASYGIHKLSMYLCYKE